MRTNSGLYNEFNQASLKDLRLVVVIHFPSPLYLTSHSGIPNLPADKLEDVLMDVSSTSQRLVPDEGRSEIGDLSFSVVDVGGAVTARFRAEQAAGEGLNARKVELYRGGAGMDWSDFRLEQTQQIDADVTLDKKGAYHVSCADVQRQMRKDIFDLAKTRLAATLVQGGSTLEVFDTSAFEACTHVASFGDQPTGSFFYLRIKYNNGFEIVRATGKTATTFTGLTRGLFGTDDVEHVLPANSDEDAGVEIEEYVYLELPAPAMAYALLTGNIIGGGTVPWSLGIDPSLVDQPSFEDIGEDWFDSSDYTKGLIFRFQSISKTDGKRFIEREVCLLAGAFLRVGADGKLYMRRMTGIIGSADYVAEINPDNAITHGPIKHDLSKLKNIYDIQWSWIDLPTESKPRFARRNVLVDASSIGIHKEARTFQAQFKGLHNERHTFTTLRNRFDALRDRYAGPPILFPVDLLPSMNDLEVGDIVRANFPNVRDFTGDGSLDRSCEIERITINQRTGRVRVDLFASTRKADPIADDGAGGTSELPDAWYSSFGTEMGTQLTIDGAGVMTANGALAGGTTTRTAYYYLGDFTIAAGVTLTVTGNAQLHILGHFQNNGTLKVEGGQAANTRGYLGTTFGGRSVIIRDGEFATTFPASRVSGIHSVLPSLEVENVAGVLDGIPNDMRGSGGGNGGDVYEHDTGAGTFTSVAAGGTGGQGGGSVVIVSRGAGYGVSGETVLSGEDGNVGAGFDNEESGSGGGGAPGCLLHMLDGSQVSVPILAGNVVARYGTSPITQGNADTQGKAAAADPVDLRVAAARILFVPKSRDPYPDFDNDDFAGNAGENAILGLLSNEAHTVAAANDGTGYSLAGAGGTFRVWDGTTDVTGSGPTYSVVAPATKNGLTIAIDAGTGVYSLSGAAWTTDLESFTLRAVYGGVTVDRIYSIAKSKAGAAGADGSDGTNGTNGTDGADAILLSITATAQSFKYNGSGTLIEPSSIDFTAIRENSTNTVSWKTQRWDGAAWVDTATNRVSPTTGLSTTLTEASFATQADPSLRVLATMTDGVTFTDAITVVKLQDGAAGSDGTDGTNGTNGSDGDDAITGFLTNEAHVVSANSDGTSYSLTGAGGTLKVFDGINDVTGSATFSVSGSATKNGLTISINTSGVYSLSGASWTSDAENFTLRAVYGGVTIDRVYSISKSKQGPSADGFVKLAINYVDSQSGTLPQSAGIVFKSDGTVHAYNNGSTVQVGKWWSNAPETGIGNSYRVRCSAILAGSWDFSAAAVGSFATMSSDQTWRVLRTVMEGSGTDLCDADFEISPVSSSTIEDETEVNASASG